MKTRRSRSLENVRNSSILEITSRKGFTQIHQTSSSIPSVTQKQITKPQTQPSNIPKRKTSRETIILTTTEPHTIKPKFGRVLYDFHSENLEEHELNLKKNDIVRILSEYDDGWSGGECKGQYGFFPTGRENLRKN